MMGYEQREFNSIPRQKFPAIDTLVIDTLRDFKPTDQYVLRDLVSIDGDSPTLVERKEPTPLTPEVQYREIRNAHFPVALRTWHPTLNTPSTPCISRWFNPNLEAEYAAKTACMALYKAVGLCNRNHEAGQPCYESGVPKIEADGFLQEDLNIGEFGFLIPLEPPKKAKRKYDEEYHPHLVTHGHYIMYHAAKSNTRGTIFTAPNIQEMYTLRRHNLATAATAYAQNANAYVVDCGMDPGNLTEDDEDKLYELERIVAIGKEDGVPIHIAVRTYTANESWPISREMHKTYEVNAHAPATWADVHLLLGAYINQIANSPSDRTEPRPFYSHAILAE